MGRPRRKPIIRLLEKVRVEDKGYRTPCWLYAGSTVTGGYGRIYADGRLVCVHRLAYEHFNGSIPDDLTIDHLCGNPCCVNPEHLEAVTIRENILRGNGAAARNARKTHCKHGHEFTSENTYSRRDRGNGRYRECKECRRDATRRWQAREAQRKQADQEERKAA